MEIEKGKLNGFFVNNHAFFTNATEEEFDDLLANFVAEKEAKGKNKFDYGDFGDYILANGYHTVGQNNRVW
jgi:hypothetical protein